MRSGFDFIYGLGAVLIMTHWTSVPTEPALWTYLQVEDEAKIMRHAASIKKRFAEELMQGRNVYERVGKTIDSRLWDGNRPPSRDTLQEKLDTLKRNANSG